MKADARAACGERDLAGVTRDRNGLGGEGEGGDPMGGGGPALVDGEREAGEASGERDGIHAVCAFRVSASRRALIRIQ